MLTFDNFHQNQDDELQSLLEAVGDREGHYLYFIAYRSPKNKTQWCLYTGIKYKDTAKAEAFFGSLRYDSNVGKNVIQNKRIWESGLISFHTSDDVAKFGTEAKTGIYMSSAAENSGSDETICDAYAKGVYDGDLNYHPLICTNEVVKNISELRKLTKNDVLEKIDEFGRKIRSELKNDTREFNIPNVASNFHESNQYGYRIYVCENMNNYQDFLNEFLLGEDYERNEDKLRSPFTDAVRDQGSENDEEFNEKELDSISEQAEIFSINNHHIILEFYEKNKKYKIRKEFETRDNFRDFLIDTFSKKENQSLRVGKAEYNITKDTHERGEKVQGRSKMINLPRNHENLSMIFASLPENEREDLIKFLGAEKSNQDSKRNEHLQKKFSFEDIKKELKEKKSFQNHFSEDNVVSKHFIDNTATFSRHMKVKRMGLGVTIEEGTVYKLLYNSPDPEKNLIVRAWKEQQASPTNIPIEKSKAKQELKYYFENFELPLIYKESASYRIERMTINIQKDNKIYYLMKNMELKPATQLTQEYEAKGIATNGNVKQLEGLFTLWDLIELLGCYNLKGLKKGHNLAPSPTEARKGKPTFFSRNAGLIEPWWKDRSKDRRVGVNDSYEPGDVELLEEGVSDAINQVLLKVGALYRLSAEQLKKKREKLEKILKSTEKYDRQAILLPSKIIAGAENFSSFTLNIDGKEKNVTQEELIRSLQQLAIGKFQKEQPNLYRKLTKKIQKISKGLFSKTSQTSSNEDSHNRNTKRKVRTFKEITKNR